MLSIFGVLLVVRFRDVWIVGLVDRSVSERSELVLSCDGRSVGFEPRGSQCVSTVVRDSERLPEMEARPSLALLFASCLVSRGVGVDGMRDRLAVLTSRCNVGVKKKVKGSHFALASLNQTIRQDNGIFIARNKSKYQSKSKKI